MAIGFDNILGVHEDALHLRAKRGVVLANNLVNADTPGYLAKDLDFDEYLQQQTQVASDNKITLKKTNSGHMDANLALQGEILKYRIPKQPSQDGNTVDATVEYSKFTENAMRYEASLRFIGGKFRGVMSAFKGD